MVEILAASKELKLAITSRQPAMRAVSGSKHLSNLRMTDKIKT